MTKPTLLDIAIVLGAVCLIACLVMLANQADPEPWTKSEQCQLYNKFNDKGVLGECE